MLPAAYRSAQYKLGTHGTDASEFMTGWSGAGKENRKKKTTLQLYLYCFTSIKQGNQRKQESLLVSVHGGGEASGMREVRNPLYFVFLTVQNNHF